MFIGKFQKKLSVLYEVRSDIKTLLEDRIADNIQNEEDEIQPCETMHDVRELEYLLKNDQEARRRLV